MPRRRRWPLVLGGIVLVIAVAAVLFRWDWLLPIVNARASAALGRPVAARHLTVDLGRQTVITLEGLTIANPPDWPEGGDFGTIDRLSITLDAEALLRRRAVVLPVIALDRPDFRVRQLPDKRNNWTFATSSAAPADSSPSAGPTLGVLRVRDGRVHALADPLAADFTVALNTVDSGDGEGRIEARAEGRYARQPITARLLGGAILSLRDATTPYPIDLKLANGPTRISLVGTVQNPLAFAGTDLKLDLSGPDMSLLLPLTGIAIPKTPPYRVAGRLDVADRVVRFEDFTGKVGSSDLSGTIAVDTKTPRPVLNATLASRLVDLKDLGGFIGAEPGDADKGTKKPARSGGKVLPDDPISLPKLTVADVHLTYRASRIEGRNQPLDSMQAKLDIVDGKVAVHPVSFSIGRGDIKATVDLAPASDQALAAKTVIDFQRVDLGKLLHATGVAEGSGAITGRASIEGTGRSVAEILGRGNGGVRLFMGPGGDISSFIVSISGLQFGNALLSALGIPRRERLMCMATDWGLAGGMASIRTMVLDTDASRIGVTGRVNLASEAIDLDLRTESKHFSIGTLPTDIHVGGSLGAPAIMPDALPLAARGGAAAALGIVGTPLAALLPTIQFGTGEDNACASLLQDIRQAPTSRKKR